MPVIACSTNQRASSSACRSRGVVISPYVSIGLVADQPQGPTIGSGVRIGTGARLLGPLTVGNGAVIGENAVVVRDVAAGVTEFVLMPASAEPLEQYERMAVVRDLVPNTQE